MAKADPYTIGLDRNRANYAPLTPLAFLARTADVFPHKLSVIYNDLRYTWAQTAERCRRLASALRKRGIGKNDTVAVMLPNIPAMVEAHFGIPMSGAVLNTLNTRLDAEAIAFMLDHGEAKVLLTDREFSSIVGKALGLMSGPKPLVIDVEDASYVGGDFLGEIEYEAFLAEGDPAFTPEPIDDEWDAIALNYTSGTTGNPKGVVYHHRGAYLNGINNIVGWGMAPHSVYLWTLPMFHCNGWCFPWTMAANAGVNVCIRRIDPKQIFELIREHQISHFCGAPIVHGMLINADPADQAGIDHPVAALIAGAAPPAAIIEGMERLGFSITHVYGLTETYGPASVCAKQVEWDAEPLAKRAELNGRQGVRRCCRKASTCSTPMHFQPVPHDGADHGRDRVPRQYRDEGLSQERERDDGELCGRLVPHRRSGGDRARRLRQDQGPLEGHHHFGRREHFVARGRGRAVPAQGRAGGGGGGDAGREMGRGALRLRRIARGRGADEEELLEHLPRASGAVQGAEALHLRTAAEDLHRQDAEIHPARTSPIS